ncbi:hypothetical protein, partial [Burkholderia cenocepacia]|uniref:hypothetical protein n=1 Tax=Burkholderia cenocepacia TaxID=95486 RepID=UPI001E5801E6
RFPWVRLVSCRGYSGEWLELIEVLRFFERKKRVGNNRMADKCRKLKTTGASGNALREGRCEGPSRR